MILIVDDRRENILPLKKILELHQFSVDTAESGEEALKKVLHTVYSVIILDVQMPDMDGFEVANAIGGFSKARDTSIIFLSAVNTEKKFIAKGYTSGGVDYLIKPADPDILVLKVKMFQKLFEQQRELRATQDPCVPKLRYVKRPRKRWPFVCRSFRPFWLPCPKWLLRYRPRGELEYVNEHWLRYAASTTSFPDIHPDDTCCDELKKALARGTEFTREVRLKELHTSALPVSFVTDCSHQAAGCPYSMDWNLYRYTRPETGGRSAGAGSGVKNPGAAV